MLGEHLLLALLAQVQKTNGTRVLNHATHEELCDETIANIATLRVLRGLLFHYFLTEVRKGREELGSEPDTTGS